MGAKLNQLEGAGSNPTNKKLNLD